MKKTRRLICSIILSGMAAAPAMSQTAADNYIKVYKAQVPITGNISAVNNKDQVTETIEYYDGLGRPVQAVVRQGSPGGYDIVSVTVYDAYGRKTKSYLPYVAGTTDGSKQSDPLTDLSNFFVNHYGPVDGAFPFAVQIMESSALGRVFKQGATGADWQPLTDPANFDDHSVKKQYRVNTADEVYRFVYDPVTESAALDPSATYYTVNTLYVNTTVDEHNNEVVEYVDKLGRTILKKVQYKTDPVEGKLYAQTYYVYDDLGRLVLVLPPEFVAQMGTMFNEN